MKKLVKAQQFQLGVYLYEGGGGGGVYGVAVAYGCIVDDFGGSWHYGSGIRCDPGTPPCIVEKCQ